MTNKGYERQVGMTCVLCGYQFGSWDSGKPDSIPFAEIHNAQPLAEGFCCDGCNTTRVIPARLGNSLEWDERERIRDN
jgi:hypothetical protein